MWTLLTFLYPTRLTNLLIFLLLFLAKKLSNWTLSSWSCLSDKKVWQRGCLNVKKDKSTKKWNLSLKNLSRVFQKFFKQVHFEKRKNGGSFIVFCFLFQQWKNYLLKDFKKKPTLCYTMFHSRLLFSFCYTEQSVQKLTLLRNEQKQHYWFFRPIGFSIFQRLEELSKLSLKDSQL